MYRYVVAGDVATAVNTIQETLLLLKDRFEEVFYCPGNHDLWTPAAPNDWTRAGHPGREGTFHRVMLQDDFDSQMIYYDLARMVVNKPICSPRWE